MRHWSASQWATNSRRNPEEPGGTRRPASCGLGSGPMSGFWRPGPSLHKLIFLDPECHFSGREPEPLAGKDPGSIAPSHPCAPPRSVRQQIDLKICWWCHCLLFTYFKAVKGIRVQSLVFFIFLLFLELSVDKTKSAASASGESTILGP